MEVLILLFLILSNIIQFYFLVNIFFYLFISFVGFFLIRKKDQNQIDYIENYYNKKFAILVPAHNERDVIKNLLDSFLYLDYPKELYDIYIICDNCTDDTEYVVRKHPLKCELLIFKGDAQSNKAKALNRATEKILSLKEYDAFCYFDADSLVHPKFLKAVCVRLKNGDIAIQAQQVPKNIRESIVSLIVSSGQFITNYFFQKPKEYLGLSATLHGKGICFSIDVVKKFKWDEECLTEDLEMQMRLILNGVHINWCENAIVYDEQPVHISQYVKRSIRWTRGSLDTAKKHALNLLKGFMKTLDLRMFEAFIYCVGVYRIALISFCGGMMYFTSDRFNILLEIFCHIPSDWILKFIIITFPFFVFPFSILVMRKIDFAIFLGYFVQPVLGFLRMPIFLLGIVKDKKKWDKTEHTSKYTIFDVVNSIESK
jgi:cellulose synthase/poly-beta-1,6-N-acetylglucosamine synthase-like glycosyltransferase